MVVGTSVRARRGAIYTRVSDPHLAKEGKISLPEQEAQARALAERTCIDIVEVYTDPGVTGTILERPAFQRMLRDMRKGRFDVIIAHKIDRFSREPVIQHWVQVEAQMYGVELQFVEMEERHLSPRERRIIETIKGLKAIMEVDDTRERTQLGRRKRAERGWLMTTRWPLFGYQWQDDEKGQRRYYIHHPANRRFVERIFIEVASGKPLKRIVIELDADGVPTRQKAAMLAGRPVPQRAPGGSASYCWTRQAVAEIIRNPSYMGTHALYATERSYRTEIDGRTGEPFRISQQHARDSNDPLYHLIHIPPIVSTDLWHAANDRLDQNSRESPRSATEPTDALLRAGYIECGHCHTSMVVIRRKNNRGHVEPAYYCRRRHVMRHVVGALCPVPCNSISIKRLDSMVWAQIVGILQQPDVLEAMLRRAIALAADGCDDTAAHLASLDEALRQARGNMDGLIAQSMQPEMPEVVREAISAKMREVGALIEGFEKRQNMLRGRREQQDMAVARIREVVDWAREVGLQAEQLDYYQRRTLLHALGVQVEVFQAHSPEAQHRDGDRWVLHTDFEGLNALIASEEPQPKVPEGQSEPVQTALRNSDRSYWSDQK